MKSTTYRDGWDAYHAGWSSHSNPWLATTDYVAAESWYDGYRDARLQHELGRWRDENVRPAWADGSAPGGSP